MSIDCCTSPFSLRTLYCQFLPVIAGICKSKGKIISGILPKNAGVRDCSTFAQSTSSADSSVCGFNIVSFVIFEITEISLISVGATVKPLSLFKFTAL